MCKRVICLSDLTKWANFDFHKKFGSKFSCGKRKLTRLEKRLPFSDYHFSIVGSNSDEGFARLESSLSIGKLCFNEAASYYNNFNMRKHKMTLFLKHYQRQCWVNLSFSGLGVSLVYGAWFSLIIKTKFKLPVYNFNCLGYLSAILVIILITRRTQRRMIQAITCTYRKVVVFPILLMLCFSDAASYYVNFYITKHKITSFETLSTTTMS